MKQKITILICILVSLAMLLSINLANTAWAGEAKKAITLKIICSKPKGDEAALPGLWLSERFNERAKGKVFLHYVGGPEVVPEKEQLEAVRTGVVDIVNTVGAFYKSAVPEVGNVQSLSPLLPWEEREKGIYDFYNQFMQKKANVYFLGKPQGGTGFYLYLGKPGVRVKRLADMKGLKIRVSGTYVAFVKALDAVPISMPKGEVYTAMERGVVDGFGFPAVGTFPCDFDMIKYRIDHSFYQNESTMLVNLDTWKKLPKDMQELLIEVEKEVERDIIPRRQKQLAEVTKQLTDAGCNLLRFPGDEGKRYVQLAYEGRWKETEALTSPEYVAKLRKLFGKTMPEW